MIRAVTYQILAFIYLFVFPNKANAQFGSEKTIETFVDSLVMTVLKKGPVAGMSIAIKKNEKILLQKGYGYADPELDAKCTPLTVYHIRSISKMFTAVSTLQLVEKGKINLDDTLKKFMPGFPEGDSITIRQLLSHTSGIENYHGALWRNNYKGLDMPVAKWVDLIKDQPLRFRPGSNYYYSNAGYDILAMIIEKVSGETYPEYIHAHIVVPAGLNQTGYFPNQQIIKNRARPYEVLHNTIVNADEWGNYGYGCCMLSSSVLDLLKFQDALNNNKLINATSLSAMRSFTRVTDSLQVEYGLGNRIENIAGHMGYGHTGSGGGWTAELLYFPADGLTITVLTNTENDDDPNFPDAHFAVNNIVRKLYRVAKADLFDLAIPANEINKYTGQWSMNGMTLTIIKSGNRLWAKPGTQTDSIRLLYQGNHILVPDFDHGIRLQFILNRTTMELGKIYNNDSFQGVFTRKE
jgi:D-alanyl-D-alanine carboxypeptidase